MVRELQSSFLFLSFLLFLSCHENNEQDSKAVKEEIRSREIVHLTTGQIVERANEIGDSIIDKAEKELSVNLASQPNRNCTEFFGSISKELEKAFQCQLKRIPFDTNRLKGISSGVEKEVLDAYFFNRENHLSIAPNLQRDGDKEFIFTRALVIKDKQCVGCHQSLSQPGLKGNLGDTLAIWDLRFTKKQVVLSFVE